MGSMLLLLVLTFFVFSAFVNNGNAGITSSFIRSEWPATDIPLDNEVFAVPNGYNAPQQVHITQGDYDGKAVIISWVTTDNPGSSKVQYGDLGQTYNSLSTLEHYMQTEAQAILFVGDLSYADRYKYNDVVKYTPQYVWLKEELEKVNREETPWLIVLMHVPIYNSNEAHFMEGESMRAVFEEWFVRYKVDIIFAGHVHAYERSYRISNIHYNVSSGECYPVADKSAPVYITVGDGGNQEGLAGKFRDPQPDYSAFREASYGHSTLEIKNRTHAFYQWNRNDDGKQVATDAFVLHNQYWSSSLRRRKLKKHHLRSVLAGLPVSDKIQELKLLE
ncbi:hypothetical protein GH714_041456 [Hevea brasiliensis]|uniref:Purple acid phosphatase n=1 Tax=Hevea brasiliensis TaxID=3981 RepID=A0A6A6MX87_HEVBR|nr:hypothetical protein GH714_041456 [Hevea brasiliensis]